MSLAIIAADIASRVPAFSQDSPVNNAAVIEGLLKPLADELAEANYWRERHSKDAAAYGEQSQKNWEKLQVATYALGEIANEDYRGNRPWSATRAHKALERIKSL